MLSIVVPSGSQTSSVFLIERQNHPLVCLVASAAANTVQFQFATTSAGPFVPLFDRQASAGFNVTAFSGTNGGAFIVPNIVSPWARVSFGAALTDATTVVVMRAGGLL